MATLRGSCWLLALAVALVACGGGGSSSTSTTTHTGSGGSGAGASGHGSSTATSSGTGGATPCTDQCGAGDAHCTGSQIQTCDEQADGCLEWSKPADCPTNQTCLGSQCVLACADKCIDGATQCNAGKLQTCSKHPNGCTDWDPATDCPSGQTCSGGQCSSSCVDQCAAGATQCSGPQIQTCAKQVNGCLDWGAAQSCPANDTCSGGQCVLACTDQCAAGASQCSGAQLQTCGPQTNGCLGWNPPTTCPTNQTCTGGACAPVCTNQCAAGATQCAGAQIQTCGLQPSGCLDWSAAQACSAGTTCQGGQCVVVPCTSGNLRCNGTVVEVCNGNAKWQAQQVCAQSCDAATSACTTQATCAAGSRRCSGNQIEVCNSTGTAWLGVQSCAVSCSGGLCTGACQPGATRCNGNTPETCSAGGAAWTAGTACATSCVDAVGACADPALTIDANANAQLNGEHYFAGDVVIKNSSVLTVTSGKLVIHAKNFILDATSQIVVSPTGNDPRGKGIAASGTGVCGSCSGASYPIKAGSGGGYGAPGGTGLMSSYCFGPACSYPSGPGGSLYGIADDEAAPGAAGGDCGTVVGGLGGGLFVVYANNIQVLGSITANGAPGGATAAGNGCASGGGSGGAVVLRADGDLTFQGSISVAGGAGGYYANVNYPATGGTGAVGVVKLLYGNTRTLTGAVVGTKFQSFMPPFDVSSTSHPDATRWYNDGFSVFELAWSKPFTTGAGYYYNLNTTYGYVPAPANSQYLAGESILYQPASLIAGTNHFHADTVGPFANVGTVEHRFAVNINTATPPIASTSHPLSGIWYNNFSPYFTWTLPHADADVINFYWVFDPYAATIPGKTSNKIPMDLTTPQNSKQLLLPGQQPGIWFLHLIAEDTMGYLTKSAAHFRVQLGTNPGQGSVSGTVTDAMTSAFLSGVSITLNRGVQTVVSNASGGYAFPNTVYAQQYEITASKAGYKDSVKMVTVTSGMTATVNFALGP